MRPPDLHQLLINPQAVYIGGRLPEALIDKLAAAVTDKLAARPSILAMAPIYRAALAADAPAMGAAIYCQSSTASCRRARRCATPTRSRRELRAGPSGDRLHEVVTLGREEGLVIGQARLHPRVAVFKHSGVVGEVVTFRPREGGEPGVEMRDLQVWGAKPAAKDRWPPGSPAENDLDPIGASQASHGAEIAQVGPDVVRSRRCRRCRGARQNVHRRRLEGDHVGPEPHHQHLGGHLRRCPVPESRSP